MPYYVLGDLDGTLNLGGLTDGSFSGLVRDLGGDLWEFGCGTCCQLHIQEAVGRSWGSRILPLVSREWRNGNYYKYHYYHSSIPY